MSIIRVAGYTFEGITLEEHEGGWARIVHATALPEADVFIHQLRRLAAIRSRDEGRWHLSVSHETRIPTWEEIGKARDDLLPEDIWLMVPHPPRSVWFNLNERVLHLWEFRDPTLQAIFQEEGERAQRGGFGTPT